MSKKKKSGTFENIGKLVDESFDQIDKRFEQVDKKLNILEEGQEQLFKMHFEQKTDIKSMEERLDNKLDKILSFVSNLVVTTEGMKQELTAIGERVRLHEDKLEILS